MSLVRRTFHNLAVDGACTSGIGINVCFWRLQNIINRLPDRLENACNQNATSFFPDNRHKWNSNYYCCYYYFLAHQDEACKLKKETAAFM